MNFKRILFVCAVLFILSVSAVSAADLDNASSVDSTPAVEASSVVETNQTPGSFADLQLEINNAPAGSVLDLYRDYKGSSGSVINLNKDLTIDGHGHTIDCLNAEGCHGFYSTSGDISIKNIQIINANLKFKDYQGCGGAVRIMGSAQYNIENCTFEKNSVDCHGGAIYNGADKSLSIKNCVFLSNKAGDCGGAVYSYGVLNIENSLFESNTAYSEGGAIYDTRNVNVNGCLFKSNKVKGSLSDCYGGAIRSKSNVNVENSTFQYNNAEDYGGAIYASNVNINVGQSNTQSMNSYFIDNKADDDQGGAIYTDGDLKAKNTEFSQNKAKVDGGAIYTCSKANVENCYFSLNKAGGAKSQCYGGAIRSKNEVRANNCTFEKNSADDYGGAIYAVDVYINSNQASGDDFNTFFIGNHADDNNGGAIYAEGNVEISNAHLSDNKALVDGGAIFSKKNVNMNHCLFESNKATGASGKCYGGAVRSTDAYVNNSTFSMNFADNHGGAIYANSMKFSDSPSYFLKNRVAKGDGGALYVDKFTSSSIKHQTFRDNEASSKSSDGGAIYINSACKVTFEQCAFISNHCGDEGGAIYLDSKDSKLTLLNDIFIGNDADGEGQTVYNCGDYSKVNNNFWGGVNPTSKNDQLIEWMPIFIPNWHEVDSNPLKLKLDVSLEYNGSKPVIIADVAFYFNNGNPYDGALYDIDCLSFIITPNLNLILEEKDLNRIYAELIPKIGTKFVIMAKFYDFYTSREVEINT